MGILQVLGAGRMRVIPNTTSPTAGLHPQGGIATLLGPSQCTNRALRPDSPVMEQSLPQELVKQVAGSFRLTALLQKRVRELVRGQKPLFETRERNFIKIAHEELKRGLIELVADEDAQMPPMLDNNA
jgi:DNA-directed RNA polymerase subunit K/omega